MDLIVGCDRINNTDRSSVTVCCNYCQNNCYLSTALPECSRLVLVPCTNRSSRYSLHEGSSVSRVVFSSCLRECYVEVVLLSCPLTRLFFCFFILSFFLLFLFFFLFILISRLSFYFVSIILSFFFTFFFSPVWIQTFFSLFCLSFLVFSFLMLSFFHLFTPLFIVFSFLYFLYFLCSIFSFFDFFFHFSYILFGSEKCAKKKCLPKPNTDTWTY